MTAAERHQFVIERVPEGCEYRQTRNYRDSAVGWYSDGTFTQPAYLEASYPNSDAAFITALHELGHLATTGSLYPLSRMDVWNDTPRNLECEAAAWEWAFDNCPTRVTKAMWQRGAGAFGTYLDYCTGAPGPLARRMIGTFEAETGVPYTRGAWARFV